MHPIPLEFSERMKTKLGNEYNEYIKSLSLQPPVCIRKNPFKPSIVFSDASSLPYCSTAYLLNERPHFHHDPLFHAGCYYVQEAGSMFIEPIFNQLPLPQNPIVLDFCAAPGGKSTHLLSLLNNRGVLVSNEIIPQRNKVLKQNIYKWGCDNVIITQSEASRFKECEELFDLIVVDAPCSGEGLFRKDKDAAAHWSTSVVAGCSRRQRDLLTDLLPALKPGGFLIYSTCTYEDAENDNIAELLIREHGLQSVLINNIPNGVVQTGYGFQFYPHKTLSEGFYISVLRKADSRLTTSITKESSFKQINNIDNRLKDFIHMDNYCVIESKHESWAVNPQVLELMQYMCHVNVKSAGVPLGNITTNFKPHAALALSNVLAYSQSIELNTNQALQYLSGNSIPNENGYIGLYLIKFQNKALGWVNAISGRCNNLYPHDWRIALKH
jgi:16S rRNA C967 or C1407 C5-methylase (RsmB/RsmF family)/NOL1/NOP2/fmu family ribosome biogenesis protein